MTESSQFDRRHDWDPRRSPWTSLFAGLLIGLLLGLLIGWVIWPVSWTNASPGDLSEEAQADYLSAVADAYVSARNLPARTLAEQRLRYFGDEAAQADAIGAARLWYNENQPDEWRVRISNLNELASALDLAGFVDPSIGEDQAADDAARMTATADASADEAASAGTGEADVTAVPDRGEPVGTEPGWIPWLFVMLTALLLIAGGLSMLRRLYAFGSRPSVTAAPDDGAGGWTSEDVDAPGESDGDRVYADVDDQLNTRVRESEQQRRGDAYAPGAYGAGGDVDDRLAEDMDEYGFDEEADDIPTAGTSSVSFEPDSGQSAPTSPAVAPADDDAGAGFAAEEGAAPTAESRTVTPGDPVTISPHPEAGGAGQSRTRRAEPGRLLDRFTAHYQFGVPDYDEAFNVRDGDNSNIIGACGMGVNIRGGLLQDNPENVVALDVWLFDKVNPNKPVTVTIVLVPRSAAEPDRLGDAHILVAEQGARFQLEAAHLILECVVEQVSSSDEPDSPGIFRDVQVAMAVSRR